MGLSSDPRPPPDGSQLPLCRHKALYTYWALDLCRAARPFPSYPFVMIATGLSLLKQQPEANKIPLLRASLD